MTSTSIASTSVTNASSEEASKPTSASHAAVHPECLDANARAPALETPTHLNTTSTSLDRSHRTSRRIPHPDSDTPVPSSPSSSYPNFARTTSARVGGSRRRAETDNYMRSSLPPTLSSTAMVVDRRLLQKYQQVNHEIERIVRASQMEHHIASLDGPSVHQVKHELYQAKKSSAQMIHAQKELLNKIEKHERGGFRRVFTLNKAAKMAKLRSKLCAKLSESVVVDEELQRLERQSSALSATTLGTITQDGKAVVSVSNVHGGTGSLYPGAASSTTFGGTTCSVFLRMSSTTGGGHTGVEEMRDGSASESSSGGPVLAMRTSLGWEDAQEELLQLEREKEDILTNLFQTVDMPAVLDLHARIASFSCEIKAITSVRKQADRVEDTYRKALHLLRVALAAVVSPHYSGSIREFATQSYPLAVEAGQLLEQACHVIQPEARRKYKAFASEFTHVRPPKFPQPVADFARRSRTHYDPHSALAIEGMRNLHAAENVVILLQRLVLLKLERMDKWQTKLTKDLEAAERVHAQLETKLQEQVAVLARSVSE
ncbi:hypothetical protein PsorP6_000683 [Peronosclerospora sorghi]|uniref:Uncharacterized protein n=1 Tax=Peronosclerospora sorghi TaxID=230839 RepID=A0ACC0WVB3_9STRA|nr:hypothetical protein PsorP6_000683 [Peronosclerospora sorghi]